MVKAFTIPPDNDDSGLNAALQSILKEHKNEFPELADLWETNYSTLYNSAKKYAYRPLEAVHHVRNMYSFQKEVLLEILNFILTIVGENFI